MGSVATALRGMLAGVAMVGFVGLFLLTRVGGVSPRILGGLGLLSCLALLAAGGFTAVRQLLSGNETTGEATPSEQSEWWVARAITPLEESWNSWSDGVVVLGLGVIGVGSFVLLATDQSETPPIGLLFVGFISSGAALVSLAVLAE
jgi:hypothetical protein